MNWQQLIPPVLMPALRRLKGQKTQSCYASWKQALIASSVDGYENNQLVDVVVSKTQRYRDRLAEGKDAAAIDSSSSASLAALLAATAGDRAVHVIDFGGAAGAHYFLARAMLPNTVALQWIVVETEAMATAARSTLANKELDFCSDLQEATGKVKQVDLLHSSGTLQCVENPYSCLENLVAVGAKFMLLNRLGLSRGDHDVITVHESMLSWNGPGPLPEGIVDKRIRYPFTFPQEERIDQILNSSYRRVAEFQDNSGIFPVNNQSIIGLGLLMKRTRPSPQA